MRNAFIEELVSLASKHDHIALIVGDLGFSVVEPFAERFPDRFFNAGVAEQNMMGLAAGMASEGYHVFTYSIANFPTFRCAEQIRNDVDYHNLSVTVVAVGGGLSYGSLGYSHHAVQDYALMRCMPNMLIAAPGDPMEVRSCLRYLVANPQPSYFRLGKVGEPIFHSSVPKVEPGKWLPVYHKDEYENVLISTGTTLGLAMDWKDTERYARFSIYSLPLWGMAAKSIQAKQVDQFKKVVTVEDHLLDGGFGSWLLESIHQNNNGKEMIEIRALDKIVCGTVGSQFALNVLGGLK